MIFVGDYFALALVIVLCCFYFDGKKNAWLMTKANKYFVACLLLTAATAAVGPVAGRLCRPLVGQYFGQQYVFRGEHYYNIMHCVVPVYQNSGACGR